jgi:lipoyl(octanoyl) transferase
VKRGGLITFHGPGQLVFYPVFNLRLLGEAMQESVGVRRFVQLIEDATLKLLREHFSLENVGRTSDAGLNFVFFYLMGKNLKIRI